MPHQSPGLNILGADGREVPWSEPPGGFVPEPYLEGLRHRKESSDTGSPVQEFCLGTEDNPHRLNSRNRRANGARRFGTRPSKSPTAARDQIVQALDGAGASKSVNYYLLWKSPSLHRPICPIRRRAEKCLRATAERDCHRFSRRADSTHQGLTLLWFHRLDVGRPVPRVTQRQRHHRRRSQSNLDFVITNTSSDMISENKSQMYVRTYAPVARPFILEIMVVNNSTPDRTLTAGRAV